MRIGKTHPFVNFSDELLIFKKKLKKLEINMVTFMRIHLLDNSHLYFSTEPNWVEDYFNKTLYQSSIFEEALRFSNDAVYLWPSCETEKSNVFYYGKDFYECLSGITLIRRYKTYVDFVFFSSPYALSKAMNYYINNLDTLNENFSLLQNLVDYYRNDLYPHQIYLPNPGLVGGNKCEATLNQQNFRKRSMKIANSDIHEFLKKKFQLNNPLTKAELRCLIDWTKGMSSKKIAEGLFISHRTVEKHLQNIRDKLGLSTRSELAQYLSNFF